MDESAPVIDAPADTPPAPSEASAPEPRLIIEELTIDGMCGVY